MPLLIVFKGDPGVGKSKDILDGGCPDSGAMAYDTIAPVKTLVDRITVWLIPD